MEFARDIPGVSIRKPADFRCRFELVVFDYPPVVLYPWRYATDGITPREKAKLRQPVSDLRRTLLALNANTISGQLTLDQAELDPDQLEAELAEEQAVLAQMRSASFAAARSRFLARSRPPGAARSMTTRARPAASAGTDDGRQPAMYPGTQAERDPRCQDENVSATPAQRAQARRIARELAQIGFALPGTLTERLTRCGRANCRCHADPPALHGPYHQWTRKAGGKTVTRLLTDDQLADYGPWLDNERKLRALVAELETLSLAIAEADPRWDR